jgi:hypothetical protein
LKFIQIPIFMHIHRFDSRSFALQVLELLPRHHNGAMQDTLQARLAEQMEVSSSVLAVTYDGAAPRS